MLIEPVKRYETPQYPAFEYVQEHPEILKKLPKRWHDHKHAIAAVSIFALIVGISQSKNVFSLNDNMTDSLRSSYRDGKLSWGGEGSMQPQSKFFTEAEAKCIIDDEAAKSGIQFNLGTRVLSNVEVPKTSTYLNYPSQRQLGNRIRNLELDGFDSVKKIGFEFISLDDFNAWKDSSNINGSTRGEINLKQTAQELRNGLEKKSLHMHIGVFYDPIGSEYSKYTHFADPSMNTDKMNRKLSQETEQALRIQVQEFVKWMKEQGAQ